MGLDRGYGSGVAGGCGDQNSSLIDLLKTDNYLQRGKNLI